MLMNFVKQNGELYHDMHAWAANRDLRPIEVGAMAADGLPCREDNRFSGPSSKPTPPPDTESTLDGRIARHPLRRLRVSRPAIPRKCLANQLFGSPCRARAPNPLVLNWR
ncbi:MAG: hypothetical protein ABJA98_01885 [Acidobacteriota bacterium]